MSPRTSDPGHAAGRDGWRPASLRFIGPRGPNRLLGGLPNSLIGFVWKLGAARQCWLLALSLIVAVLDAVPIEIQRRIVNQTIKQGDISLIALLAAGYAALAAAQGLIKMVTNIFRSWVSETAVRTPGSIGHGHPQILSGYFTRRAEAPPERPG